MSYHTYQIIAQNPVMACELQAAFAATDAYRREEVRKARIEQGRTARYVVIEAGFPRTLWLIWDTQENDNVRGGVLGQHPWSASKAKMLRIAARLNRADAKAA